MNPEIFDQHVKEECRWRILRVLDAGRPVPVTDTLLLDCLVQAEYPVTLLHVRRDLDYLADHGLIVLRKAEDPWRADLTGKGVDVVEYNAPPPPGVSRPKRV